MKWLRWWGLGAFVAIVGGVVLLWVLFADTLVRRGVEAAGTAMVGARVEVADADIGFSPARLELRGLAVTDPDAPMRNALEAGRLAFDIDWIGLLLDRVHIDEVAVEGLRFGTERERSGALMRTERTVARTGLLDAARERAEIPPLEVPSAASVLEREQLESPAVIERANATLRKRREALDRRLEQLPGDDALARYQRKIEQATDGDDAASRFKGLKRLSDLVGDIRDDLESVRRARDEARRSIDAAQRVAAEARRAPQADVERLYRKYTDPAAVAGELAHYLLGPKVEGWVNQGWYWYARLEPYLGGDGEAADTAAGPQGPQAVPAVRRPGRTVVYPEADAEPSVLVRRVGISGTAGAGDLDGRVTDIAVPASLWAEPLRLDLSGESVSGIRRLRVEATVDRRDAATGVSEIDLEAGGTDVAGLGLGPDNGLRAEQGRADLRVSGTIRGRALDLDLTSVIRDVSFRATDEVEPLLREVAGALSGAGALRIGARVGGTIDAPDLELTSSLGDLLAPLLRGRLREASAGFRDGLASAVTGQTGDGLADLDRAADRLETIEDAVGERVAEFEQALKRAGKPLE